MGTDAGSPGFSSTFRVSSRRSFGGFLGHRRSVFVWRHPAKRRVRTALVVVPSPRFDIGSGVGQRQEPVGVQAKAASRHAGCCSPPRLSGWPVSLSTRWMSPATWEAGATGARMSSTDRPAGAPSFHGHRLGRLCRARPLGHLSNKACCDGFRATRNLRADPNRGRRRERQPKSLFSTSRQARVPPPAPVPTMTKSTASSSRYSRIGTQPPSRITSGARPWPARGVFIGSSLGRMPESGVRSYKAPPSLSLTEHWNYEDRGKDFFGGCSVMSQGRFRPSGAQRRPPAMAFGAIRSSPKCSATTIPSG